MKYEIQGNIYEIVDDVDIAADYIRVQQLADVDETYKARMVECAVKLNVCKDGVVVGLIYVSTDEYRSDAVSLWSIDIYSLMVLWAHVQLTYSIKQIRVVPHRKEDVLKYVSIATGDSLRRYHNGSMPYILIDFKRLKDKYERYIKAVV